MKLPRWFLTGMAGCFVGMMIWVTIGYFTMAEIGFIAWGVGFIVGAAVRYGVISEDGDESFLHGVFAAAAALVSIVLAKYLIFSMLIMSFEPPESLEMLQLITSDDSMIASMADDVADEMTAQKKKLKWPQGSNRDTASKESDYPAVVWKEAKKRWVALDETKRNEAKEERRQAHRVLMDLVRSRVARSVSFGECFSPHDLLWFGLAAITAFRVGTGSPGRDD